MTGPKQGVRLSPKLNINVPKEALLLRRVDLHLFPRSMKSIRVRLLVKRLRSKSKATVRCPSNKSLQPAILYPPLMLNPAKTISGSRRHRKNRIREQLQQ
ncbi:MAG: hypothetical protein M2R45_03109 [Verrucomicrobia subdivision 3 bacterium]|nr:hypothetical protein [Limisphaerales bacterium]MCS1413177.1 hypothetical protein [Limisphaerales bacterium]